jgi:hypothetical protein
MNLAANSQITVTTNSSACSRGLVSSPRRTRNSAAIVIVSTRAPKTMLRTTVQ